MQKNRLFTLSSLSNSKKPFCKIIVTQPKTSNRNTNTQENSSRLFYFSAKLFYLLSIQVLKVHFCIFFFPIFSLHFFHLYCKNASFLKKIQNNSPELLNIYLFRSCVAIWEQSIKQRWNCNCKRFRTNNPTTVTVNGKNLCKKSIAVLPTHRLYTDKIEQVIFI